ncbi:DUF1343 domain-containing protein [Flavivirga abyssicola]|uniref:exo-beta-N-acetylmuramidase NamZ family protein n=1 Tax=Flavivirga abyssicola TaxID=3063533 RepID=UPI0026E03B1B|nr:DUF1343 domain-containing protein [Flavivirga sp. MEBiC07777]WVK12060.1 DUF1343 domain-containing protein [Flavivirga sp. MEBiC07777]
MRFNVFKNTVLLFVFIMISCASKAKSKISLKNEISHTKKNDSVIIVGANQTDNYLSFLNGKRVGIVANQTSVIFKKEEITVIGTDPETNEQSVVHVVEKDTMTHLVDSLMALKVDIKKVFSPEHGFRGRVDAGELVKDGIDTKTNLPIVSLYGKNKKPTKEQLEGLDIVIFDIQDVGVRFYTYISTLHYIMEACSEQGIPVLVLDRPNPNGHYIDGPTLEVKNKSFLGMHPIPLVHGMTIGEYAQMINGEQWLKNGSQCDLTVISIKNYTHNTFYSLPLRPSPNLPNDQAIKLYPSLGLFEGTNINAGRGTEFQFQRFGAPFIDKTALPFSYTPVANFGAKYPKHKGVVCYGKDLKNEELNGVMTLKWVIEAYQNSTDKSLFFNTNNFTKHAGTDKLQKQIEAGLSETEIKTTWQDALERFKETRSKYLIYD